MPDFVAPSSLRAKLRDGLRATAAFSPSASKDRARTRPPLAPRQQKLRAIWINAMLWTFQGWMAMLYAGAAFAKLTVPQEHLIILMGWPAHVPAAFVITIALLETLLVLGLLSPVWRNRFNDKTLSISAIILLIIQTTALLYHAINLHIGATVLNIALIGMSAAIILLNDQRNVSSSTARSL